MLTHSNIVSNICQIDAAEHIGRGDPTLGLLPFSHIYGMTVVLFGTLSQGAKLVTLPKFDPEAFLKCLQMKQIRIAPLVPPLILFLAKHPVVSKFDLTSIQSVFSAAACLGAELTDEFLHRHNHGCRVLQGYGLTETSPAINTDTVGISGSVGCLVPNTIGKILDVETGLPLGPGQEGEYCMKGPQIMKGYHKNEEATRGMIDEDGWLHTGDIGHFTEKGVLYISERLKELIKYKGHQVSPAELENLLLTHPGVADAAVIGVPDPVAEELPRAYVVRQPGQQVEEKEIVDFVEGKVSPAKRLRGGVEFVNEIPKNPSGKILRRVLRAQLSK
ncbi:probable 4-coumarate--CoA ligase 1 [Aplysia californica]|uniref:Probable 4-coumarate--CoA ligase 1 n=1 Tax=Aplysia californica TaxID=6500 RepID=A0ABM1VQW0_APLCA|nr:probable 4-coumarate--CoA ligase 1 [Aplysia californica]